MNVSEKLILYWVGLQSGGAKGPKSVISRRPGFTLIELLVVIVTNHSRADGTVVSEFLCPPALTKAATPR
jgi:hypothetical protein